MDSGVLGVGLSFREREVLEGEEMELDDVSDERVTAVRCSGCLTSRPEVKVVGKVLEQDFCCVWMSL